jgi:predicted nucleotidyltransferase
MTARRPAYKLKPFPLPPALVAPLQSCAAILVVNWLTQGMRGMGRRELTFRLLLEALLAAGIAPMTGWPVALFVAHSLSWTLNGQIWVCARYCRLYRGDTDRLHHAVAELAIALRRTEWLQEAALIGSAAAGRLGERSDIDLRLVTPPGLVGWLRVNLLLLRLRTRALVWMLPLDAYAPDRPEDLLRSDPADAVRLLVDRDGRLRRALAGRRLVE